MFDRREPVAVLRLVQLALVELAGQVGPLPGEPVVEIERCRFVLGPDRALARIEAPHERLLPRPARLVARVLSLAEIVGELAAAGGSRESHRHDEETPHGRPVMHDLVMTTARRGNPSRAR